MRRFGAVLVLGSAALAGSATADGYRYDPSGKPDPFRAPEATAPIVRTCEGNPYCGVDLSAARLTGIVVGQANPVAMLETASGEAIMLRRGMVVGNARVEEIHADRVVFVQILGCGGTPIRSVRELKL